jgi:hypothetical protein
VCNNFIVKPGMRRGEVPDAPPARGAETASMLTVSATDALERLAQDLGAAAWLLPEDHELRGYLVMLAALPAEPDAWHEVIDPWLEAMRRGEGPALDGRGELAAAGGLAVAALRASRDVPEHPPLAAALRAVARSSYFLVRADAR